MAFRQTGFLENRIFDNDILDKSEAVVPVMPPVTGAIDGCSSVCGLLGGPGAGNYNSTKFALEGLSEALALEVEPFGIRVTAIEPGPFRTDWAGRSVKLAKNPIAEYANTAGARREQITGRSGKQTDDTVCATDAIIKVVESSDPPGNLIPGKNALDRVRVNLAALVQSIDDWEDVKLGADYPAA
jgi:NAD(P)-dependent dehydrogenase (short-subunit alcohol dehydrogenase family)